MDVVARLELRRAELQMLVDSLNERAAKLTERDAYGDLAVAQNLEALRSRVLDAAEDAGFDVAYGQVMAPRETARSVHTGFPMSAEQRTVSALRATNVHARSVHCRRAAMYVHPGDHSRRFGPELPRNDRREVPFDLRVYCGPWIDLAGTRRSGLGFCG